VSQEQLSDTRDFLAFRMRGALQLMVRLPDTPARTELASNVADLRKKIFGPQGILHHTEEYVERSQDLEEEHAQKKVVVRDITTATERLMASAHAQLTQAGHSTQVTTQRLILILALAAIGVATIVVMTTLVIVERQINQRIALLTNSVLRIAAGDIQHETRVSGHDELGRMAEALEIFKRNARELLRSNSELEKFAYAAAHDLRTPLQAIHDLTIWTIEDNENQLSDDSVENLKLLQDRIGKLNALLTDLLRYARIGAEIEELSEVDLDVLVHETMEFIDPAGAFEVTHDWDGTKLETYPHPLRKVLTNLMSNTLKHHGANEGHIHISSVLKQNRLWIEYNDDGSGIPEEFHSKVFELFQTLKPKDEMEGSGLGLAITQKLVEQFDGAITVRSNPEKVAGVTFVFDFPAKVSSENLAKAA
jgi:signal transduction histidine kinase